jgi:hypothetical protein
MYTNDMDLSGTLLIFPELVIYSDTGCGATGCNASTCAMCTTEDCAAYDCSSNCFVTGCISWGCLFWFGIYWVEMETWLHSRIFRLASARKSTIFFSCESNPQRQVLKKVLAGGEVLLCPSVSSGFLTAR